MSAESPTGGVPGVPGARSMLVAAFARAADEFGAVAVGDPAFGWRDRSLGGPVEHEGVRRWLRVVWARSEWARGAWWTGNSAADGITGVAKPRLLSVHEHSDGPVVVRGELMTDVGGRPCAPVPALRNDPGVDEGWWAELAQSMRALDGTITTRTVADPAAVRQRIAVFFGHEVETDLRSWRPSHGDLHWNNVHRGPFAMLDWEAWGLAPRGYDAAFLLCHSLAVPAVADDIAVRFRDDLETDDGVVAQLYVLTKLLTRADGGERLDLVAPIHRHVDRLLGRRSAVTRPAIPRSTAPRSAASRPETRPPATRPPTQGEPL